MPFGQLVVGSPGAGKSTYCHAAAELLRSKGRPVAVVNLDPANERTPYERDIDVKDLITVEETQDRLNLGPNGALMYCMEYLEQNVEWLREKLAHVRGRYLIFDCPGQVELYCHHESMRSIVNFLSGPARIRLACVHMVDSHLCTAANKYISALMVSLSSMLHLELPHINVLAKIDNLNEYGELPFELDFFKDAVDLRVLCSTLEEDQPLSQYQKLSEGLCDVIEDFSLVDFATLTVTDEGSVNELAMLVDKCNGYVFADS